MTFAKIRPSCPECGRKFRAMEVGTAATALVRRTCCGARWRLKATPLGSNIPGARIDRVEIWREQVAS